MDSMMSEGIHSPVWVQVGGTGVLETCVYDQRSATPQEEGRIPTRFLVAFLL